MTATAKLRHVVMFGFRQGTTAEETAEIVRRFTGLKDLVPGIEELEWGENNSPEGLNQGLSHCFLLTFATAAARDAYLPHPDHKAFVEWVGPWVEHVTVLDYWAEGAA